MGIPQLVYPYIYCFVAYRLATNEAILLTLRETALMNLLLLSLESANVRLNEDAHDRTNDGHDNNNGLDNDGQNVEHGFHNDTSKYLF